MVDRYVTPFLARCLAPLLDRYPARHHLRALARYLRCEDPPCAADVIVILGGGTLARADTGARLYRRGLAADIYLSCSFDPALAAGESENTSLRHLLAAGIPRSAIIHDARPRTTHEEAGYFLAEATGRGWGVALLVTDPPHLRRAMGTFRRAASDLGKPVVLRGIAAGEFPDDAWWRSPRDCATVIGEYAGLLWYAGLGRI